MARPTYNLEYFVEHEFDANGEPSKRLAVRLQIEGGRLVRFCIGYQIRDPISGKLKDIVRYDNAGGYFHRHSAGFPPGKDHIAINLPPGISEIEYIDGDLAANANIYEAQAVIYGYEVLEDEES